MGAMGMGAMGMGAMGMGEAGMMQVKGRGDAGEAGWGEGPALMAGEVGCRAPCRHRAGACCARPDGAMTRARGSLVCAPLSGLTSAGG